MVALNYYNVVIIQSFFNKASAYLNSLLFKLEMFFRILGSQLEFSKYKKI